MQIFFLFVYLHLIYLWSTVILFCFSCIRISKVVEEKFFTLMLLFRVSVAPSRQLEDLFLLTAVLYLKCCYFFWLIKYLDDKISLSKLHL